MPVTSKVTHASVAETAARLIAEVDARAMRYFTTIDHSAEAGAWASSCEAQLATFGNPYAGTPIMQAAPWRLDLPLNVRLREDRDRTASANRTRARGWYRLTDELAAALAGIDALTDATLGR
jgi:uncharacterized protein (DUF302 family)